MNTAPAETPGQGAWRLRDVIFIGTASLAFSAVYLANVWLGVLIGTILAPFGLAPLANEPICGVWFMAGTFAAAVLKRPGAAVASEMLAALLEVLMGGFYGPLVFIDGLVQGLGSEAALLLCRYRMTLKSMCLAGLFPAMSGFAWEMWRSGLHALDFKLLAAMLPLRALSGILFAGVLTWRLAQALSRAGVLRGLEAPGKGQASSIPAKGGSGGNGRAQGEA
jgi:energy-coupling factor transport system substrate-specific component